MWPRRRSSVRGAERVVPLKNSTEPVGVPAPGLTAATVAVSVTGWPETTEVTEDETVVVDCQPGWSRRRRCRLRRYS